MVIPHFKNNSYNILLIIVIAFVVYYNALNNAFVWLDESQIIAKGLIIENSKDLIRVFTTGLGYPSPLVTRGDYYRPFVDISFTVDYYIWRLNPLGYHLSSILLHIISSILVYNIFCLILKDSLPALLGALLFAVHPVHTCAVSWISGRADPLCASFFLGSLYLYINAAHKTSKNTASLVNWLALASFFFALLSKEMAITLPLIIILYWYFFLRESSNTALKVNGLLRTSLFYIALFFAVAVFYVALRWRITGVVGAGQSFFKGHPYEIFLTMPKVIFDYLGLLFLPITLTISDAARIYTSISQPEVVISLLSIIALFVIAAALKNKRREVSFAILWFFITLLPVSNIIPAKHFRAERFLYIPSIGLFLLLAFAFKRLLKVQQYSSIIIISIFFIIAALAARTIWRNRDFKDDFTLFTKTVQTSPYCSEAHLVLANLYLKQNNYKIAIEEYKKALSPHPDYITFNSYYEGHNNLGLSLARSGFLDDAILEFKEAQKICPSCAEVQGNLNLALSKKAKIQEENIK